MLVGDPNPNSGSGSDVGRIHWYFVGYEGIFDPSEFSAFDKYDWFAGGEFFPAGMATGARFGTALAALPASFGTPTDAVAVGAPGENAVYMLEVDPTWDTSKTPDEGQPFADTAATLDRVGLADLTACTPAGTVTELGDELLFHDLNGDDLPELIIGASGDEGSGIARGHVFIVKGTNAFPFIDTTTCLSFVNANGGVDDAFGASLAAGALRTGGDHDLLAVGSPGEQSGGGVDESGGLCFIALDDDDASGNLTVDASFAPGGIDCRSNPFPIASGDRQRFGQALATGNFVKLDRTGDDLSMFALVEELVVGTPGGRPVETVKVPGQPTHEYANVPGAVDQGTVTVFRPAGGGPLILPPVGSGGGSLQAEHQTQIIDVTSAAAGDRYGQALFTADLQNNTHPDLIIGAPDRVPPSPRTRRDGVLYATRGTPVNGLQSGLAGLYQVQDANPSVVEEARVMDFGADGISIAVEAFRIEVRDTNDDLCALDLDSDGVNEFTGSATFDLFSSMIALDPATHTSQATGLPILLELPQADVGVADMTVEATIWVSAGSGGTGTVITYALEEPEVDGKDEWPSRACIPRPSPNDLTWTSFAVCE